VSDKQSGLDTGATDSCGRQIARLEALEKEQAQPNL
jgi:hypothetical protein